MLFKIILAGILGATLCVGAATIQKRPRLLGVAHMALYVSDLEKTRGFYHDFLGFQEPYDLKNADGSLSLRSEEHTSELQSQ